MSIVVDKLVTVSGVLASAVANGGTFTIANPAGFSPIIASVTGNVFLINQISATAGFAFGASQITVTNNSGATWAAGSEWYLELEMPDGEYYVGQVTAANDTVIEKVFSGEASGFSHWNLKSNALTAAIDTNQALNDFVDELRVGDVLHAMADADGTPSFGVYRVNANDGTDVDVADLINQAGTDTD